MSFTGIYQFGSITTKNGQVLKLEDFDTDGDGKISQQEFIFIQKELCMDTLELSTEENKGEKRITDEEYVTWALEMRVDKALNDVISQVAADFIGSNAEYSSEVIAELRQFLSDFKSGYKDSGEDLLLMADKFDEEIQIKYNEIKERIIGDDEEKDYAKVQEEWDKFVKEFEDNIANAGSIDEFVKLNREYIKEHREYIHKMLASKDLSGDERQSLIQESKGDFSQIEYFSRLSGEGRNMKATTNEFIERLAKNCPGWKDLEDNPIITDPDMYMLQFFYEYRDNPSPLKESMTVEYWKHINQQYSILETKYQREVEAGHINVNKEVDLSPEKDK